MAHSQWKVSKTDSAWRCTCCNPFRIQGHTARKNSVRPVTKWMCEKFPFIQLGSRICGTCRKKLAKVTEVPDFIKDVEADTNSSTASNSPFEDSTASNSPCEDSVYEPSDTVQMVNQCLMDLGQTPLTKRKLQSKKYSQKKLEVLTTKMSEVLLGETEAQNDESEIVHQLKEKIQSTSQNSVKLQILTILPKSWTIQRIETEFGVSNFMARKAKQLVRDKGILSSPDPRPGRHVSQEILGIVISFYENDEYSRCMPGKKDFVSVQSAHGRIHVQKRLILCNLKELHQHFKTKYLQQRIGFSKFAELRPKHCVLAGVSGTHSVCVCTIHQNVMLMLLGARLHELTSTSDFP